MLSQIASLLLLLSAVCWTGVQAAESTSNWEGYKNVVLRTHSLSQPYLDTDFVSRWFDFGGDTVVRADKYVRLSSDKPSRSGWLYSRVPLTATNFEVCRQVVAGIPLGHDHRLTPCPAD